MHNKITISSGKHLIVIYKKPTIKSNQDNPFYFKYVSGYYTNYYEGMKNQYGHEIVLIIETQFHNHRLPLRTRLLRKIISFLEKLERRIS